MDRNIVYPGAIPLDTDLLAINRNTMVALGYLIKATFGTGVMVDGLLCSPTLPPSMSLQVSPGSMTQMSVIDSNDYGSLAADATHPLMKMGINVTSQTFNLQSPLTFGSSVEYLIECSMQESDQSFDVLPYYNATNPAQPYSGPTNSGLAQATLRSQYVQLQLKTGVPSITGTQLPPQADLGWIGLYTITVAYGQISISSSNISALPTAPFVAWRLHALRPGFGSGVQSFAASDTFMVPAGVTRVEAELWGGGSGSFASTTSSPSGGGAGGGYSRKVIEGLTPGQTIPVTIGTGGTAGLAPTAIHSGIAAGSGGTTSFGQFVSATGGSLNHLASPSNPFFGATPSGTGIGGDVNLTGSAGQAGILNQGGMGGASPMGGSQNSGTTGVQGATPGGGASGAGTGANSNSSFDGAPGADGLLVVRY